MSASYDKRIVDSHANVRSALRPTSCEQRAIGELESPRLTVHKDIGRTMPGAVLNLELSARAMQTFVSLGTTGSATLSIRCLTPAH